MMLPTEDRKLKESIRMSIYTDITPVSDIGGERLVQAIDRMTDKILADLDKRGYHVGLPTSIEEALNSGDGVYRP